MCGCRICICMVFLEDFRVGGRKGSYTVSSGDGEKLNLTMRCRKLSHMLKVHFIKGSSGCAGVVSHLLLPYLLAASTRPPLHHLGLERCSAILDAPVAFSLAAGQCHSRAEFVITEAFCRWPGQSGPANHSESLQNTSRWVNAGGVTLTLQGLDSD